MKPTLPPLIVAHDIKGYDADLLDECLGEKFTKWMRGQTVMEYTKIDGTKGMLVYKWDVENYLEGGAPLD